MATGNLCAAPGTGVPVASVAAGFPAGQTSMVQRLEEIRGAVADGALEIDIVISREHVLQGNWTKLYEETKQMREACGESHLKTILSTGQLANLTNIYKASPPVAGPAWVFFRASGPFNFNPVRDADLPLVVCWRFRPASSA